MSSSLTRRLGRTTSSGRVIPEVDGLRFVAIASVFAFHVNAYLTRKSALHAASAESSLAQVAATGQCGVHLFFMISGFILALPWIGAGPPAELRAYFWRRLTRIEPPYLVSLAVITLAYYGLRQPPPADLVPHFLASAVYMHTAIFGTFYPPNCVTWSLETEIQFYTLLPLLAFALFRARPGIRRAGLWVLIFLGCCLGWAVQDSAPLSLSLVGTARFFLAGILIADLFQDWRQRERSGWWDLAGLAGFFLVPIVGLRWAALPLLPALMLVFVAALRGRLIRHLLSHPFVVVIGGMCYSIYLLHYPLISFVGRYTLPLGEGLAYPLYGAIQLALVGALVALPILVFFVGIERPCMDRSWPRRLRFWLRSVTGLPRM